MSRPDDDLPTADAQRPDPARQRRRTVTRRALLGGAVGAVGLAGVGVWYGRGTPPAPDEVPTVAPAPTGRPGPDNTGVRPGSQLKAVGDVAVYGGEELSDLHITGPVNIRGTGDVSLTNCLIDGPVRNDTNKPAGTIHLVDCEVIGIVRVARVVATRIHVHDANDLWTPYVASTISDSYLAKPVRIGDLHPDCAQFNSGVHTMTHCTLDAVADYSEAEAARINSCVQITADLGACRVTLDDCSFRGGNYSVNLKTQPDAWLTMTDCVFDPAGRKYGSLIGRSGNMQLQGNEDEGLGAIKPFFVAS